MGRTNAPGRYPLQPTLAVFSEKGLHIADRILDLLGMHRQSARNIPHGDQIDHKTWCHVSWWTAVAESITHHAIADPNNLPIDPPCFFQPATAERCNAVKPRTDRDRSVRVEEILVVLRGTVAVHS